MDSPGDASCHECGAALVTQAAFCHECGARLEEGPPALGSERPIEPRTRIRPPSSAVPPSASSVESVTPSPAVRLPSELSKYRERLRETFGFPEFRDGQAEVLTALASRDTLAVMPTGSGKSLCYALPALEVGRTLVVSPLIALMQDQVESLQAVGVAATFINSNLGRDEQNRRYRDFVEGRTDLLFVAPERFQNAAFTSGLQHAGVHLLAIDEAHCISEWGHNFRPDYLQLGAVRERLGSPRTLALTATANPQVRRDITTRLGIAGDAAEIVTSVDRPNLHLAVVPVSQLEARRRWVVDYALERPDAAGIVYVRTRRGVEELTNDLVASGVEAAPYHAGLGRTERSTIQRRFMLGDLQVIVATNAFGMGIDKPDVRYVVHLNLPARIEAYYQEAGRAGRDGDPAECILLYGRRDRVYQQHFIEEAHPEPGAVREMWQRWVALAGPEGQLPVDLGDGDQETFALVVGALRESGLLDPVALRLNSFDPEAPIDVSGITRHRAHAEARLREMTEYAETTRCRRALVLRYFGEDPADRCDACDRCTDTAEDGPDGELESLVDEILELREQIARTAGRDPYLVFENRTARELAQQRPRDREELLRVWGIGGTRADWFGRELLHVIADWESEHTEASPRVASLQPRLRAAPGEEARSAAVSPEDPLFETLRAWRSEQARDQGSPAYTICSDRTLRELVAAQPRSRMQLLEVWGLGESRVERYGDDLLRLLGAVE